MSTEFGSNIEGVIEGLPPLTPEYVREARFEVKDPNGAKVYHEPRVRIILEEQSGIPPSGQYFGINGDGYMLKPGMPADVPVGIVDILNHAIESEPVVDETTNKVIRFRNRLRLPYRIIRHIAAETPIPPMERLE